MAVMCCHALQGHAGHIVLLGDWNFGGGSEVWGYLASDEDCRYRVSNHCSHSHSLHDWTVQTAFAMQSQHAGP